MKSRTDRPADRQTDRLLRAAEPLGEPGVGVFSGSELTLPLLSNTCTIVGFADIMSVFG